MMGKKTFLLFFILVAILSFYFLKEDIYSIPSLIGFTFLRMILAYMLCILFSIPVGILVGHNETASRIIVPILDILQSVPILGFLPFAIIFLVDTFPGGYIGEEIAAIFLIFTSMTWAVVFNVIEGTRSIPADIRDAAQLTGLSGLRYLFEVVLPAIYPAFISGSMTAWGGGWYFLVAGEMLNFGEKTYILPGIGSFISSSAFAGNIFYSIIGIAILALMVLFMNTFVWRPLLARAKKYAFETTVESENEVVPRTGIIVALENLYLIFKRVVIVLFQIPAELLFKIFGINAANYMVRYRKLSIFEILLMVVLFVSWIWLLFFVKSSLIDAQGILLYSVKSIGRIFIAYLIALTWTMMVGVWIGRNKKLLSILMPIFDIGQSIPAIAVFPVVVVLIINFFGNIGIEIASIILLLTGMQWYLLFNIIRAVQQVPSDVLEVASIMNMKRLDMLRDIMLPAIFPSLVFASMQAFGGAWNASIVSEYVFYEGRVYHTEGLGYLLNSGSLAGDTVTIGIAVLTMSIIIVLSNNLLWARMMEKAQKYYF